jgi:hypothetical protein
MFSMLKNVLHGFAVHRSHAWYPYQSTMVTCSKPQEAAAVWVPAYLRYGCIQTVLPDHKEVIESIIDYQNNLIQFVQNILHSNK